MTRLPVYFVSHGGGPWPWMKDQFGPANRYGVLEHSLKEMATELGNSVRAILMITGHWETPAFAISAGSRPPMLYDYSGFPPETYEIQYPAPGDPALALRIEQLLSHVQIPATLDTARGYDHGTFTVMYPMYPNADVPVVQLSVRLDYDADAHLHAGRALATLRNEGVVIIGSGLSFHNLALMGPAGAQPSAEFDSWLQGTVKETPDLRWKQLSQWTEAPSARIAHPREDHLLPLMVAAGAAEDDTAECIYHEDKFFDHLTVSSFRFGSI